MGWVPTTSGGNLVPVLGGQSHWKGLFSLMTQSICLHVVGFSGWYCCFHYSKLFSGTSPAVQWWRLCASAAGGAGSVPGRGTKIPHVVQRGQKKKKENYFHYFYCSYICWWLCTESDHTFSFMIVAFFSFFFQFYWDIIDIQQCISLRCTAQWHKLREHPSSHRDTELKK